MKNLPKYLYRHSDGMRYTRQKNGLYSMDKSMMHKKYEYDYETLIKNKFVDSLSKCEIEIYRTDE